MEQTADNITLDTRIAKRADITAADLDGEIGMMDIENGRYYALDPIGSDIWRLLTAAATARDICDRLVTEYDVDRETCQTQVLEFLNELSRKGLLDVQA
jgi:hypothetical protein